MAEKQQSLHNHARIDPKFHVALTGLCLLGLTLSILSLVRHPGLEGATFVVITVTLLWNSMITRAYPLQVQDRVIRLEERLRLEALLSAQDQGCVEALTEKQLIGLRFASDAEAPALARRAVDEGLSSKQIKTLIQAWRADTFRV